jgi:hypothetical protein
MVPMWWCLGQQQQVWARSRRVVSFSFYRNNIKKLYCVAINIMNVDINTEFNSILEADSPQKLKSFFEKYPPSSS